MIKISKLLFATLAVYALGACSPSHDHDSHDHDHEHEHHEHSDGDAEGNPAKREALRHEKLANPITNEIPKNIRRNELAFAAKLPTKKTEKSLDWIHRGPYNKGGRTRALAFDRTNEDIILAGGVSGGVWRSIDGGESWVKVTDPSDIHSVHCITQDPRDGNENIWYYGTGEEHYGLVSASGFDSRLSGDGMFKSTDNGATWSHMESTASGTPQSSMDGTYDMIWNIIVDNADTIANSTILTAATQDGIIRSEDGGDTWTQVLGFNGNATYTFVYQRTGGDYFAYLSGGTSGGFHYSEDGINWETEFGVNYPDITNGRRCVMTENLESHSMYFLYEYGNSGGLHKLFRFSENDYDVWSDLSSNLPQFICEVELGSGLYDLGSFGTQNSYDMAIAIHPTDTNSIFIAGRNIFRSTDGFNSPDNQSWIGGYQCNQANPRDYSYPNHHSDQHVMIFSQQNPSKMFNANDGGIYFTDDALADSVVWTPMNNGYITTQFYTVNIEEGNTDSDIIMGGMQDNGTWVTTTNQVEDDWYEVHNDDGAYCAIPEGADYYCVSSQSGRIYKKQLNAAGEIINQVRIDPSSSSSNEYQFINPFIMNPGDMNSLYVVKRDIIMRHNDIESIAYTGEINVPYEGDGWVDLDETDISSLDGNITCLDFSEADPSTLWYATAKGKVFYVTDINGTPVQTEIDDDPFPGGSTYSTSIAPNDLDADEWMLTFSNYEIPSIFHTNDGGETWTDISGNLEENIDGSGSGPAVFYSAIYPSNPVTYFVATSTGVYSTTDLDGFNTVWEMEGENTIGNVATDMIKTRTYDGTIAIGTHGTGIFTSHLTPVSIEETAQSGIVHQHYPNPFTSICTIEYVLENTSNVSVNIFDINGKKIETLINETQAIGSYKLEWNTNGKNLPNGTYIYQIATNNKEVTGKLILTQNGKR